MSKMSQARKQVTTKKSVNSTNVTRSEAALQTAKKHLERNEEYESMKTLVDFIVGFRGEAVINTAVTEFIMRYILPPLKYEEDFSDEDYNQRMERLKTFMRAVLGIPKDEQCVGPLVTHEMSKSFEAVVSYFIQSIDKLRPRNDNRSFDHDLGSAFSYFIPPESHKQINLGINYWPILHSLIGPSRCAGKLYGFHLTQAIRMVSIMFGVNRYWGTLFGNLTKRQIVPNSTFLMLKIGYDEVYRREWNEELQGYYPFLFEADVRRNIYCETTVNVYLGDAVRHPCHAIRFTVPKEDTLKIAEHVLSLKDVIPYWMFSFKNNKEEGPGVTRQFYSKFSRDIKRHDLNLWIGEPQLASDGVKYVNSPCGLYPSPCLVLDDKSKHILTAIGKLMAKALMDNMLMDLQFSPALYKYLVEGANKVQCLNLNDVKDVVPSLTKFVDAMVDIMKEASRIKSDSSLTSEEKQHALSNLNYDGCSFEDLCINFTLPGFPDIEMVKGGAEKFLSVDNIEEYLQLVVWWLLYKGPQAKLECIRAGYTSILDEEYFVSILPEDMDKMLCGIGIEQWTIEELRKSCMLGKGLQLESPLVKNLFQVLFKFSPEEQKQFLKFVTGSPNLPVGGLSSLQPNLIIDTFTTKGDPDKYLPKSMTCSNLLILPKYTNQGSLEKKLRQVIREVDDSISFDIAWSSSTILSLFMINNF